MSPQLPGKFEQHLVDMIGQVLAGVPPAEQAGLLATEVLQPVVLALLRCGVRPWVLINGLRGIVGQVPRSDDPGTVAELLAARWRPPQTWRRSR